MGTSEVDSSTLSVENTNFFLLPEGVQRQQTRHKFTGGEMKILNVYLSTEAVELIQEAEASILERYAIDKDTDREALRKFNAHTRLLEELSKVRNLLNP